MYTSEAVCLGGQNARNQDENLLSRTAARLRHALLRLSAPVALIASATAAAANLIHTITLGPLPVPFYAVPVLLCGWGRCRPRDGVIIFATSAVAAAGSHGAWSFTAAFVVSLTMLAVIWWSSLTARNAYELERLRARRDGLTGCLTLHAFHEALGLKLAAARSQGRPVALAYLDLDHFKDVNDRYGHAVGDRLLSEFATELCSRLLDEDVVGRLGGDEFAVLLAEVHGPCAVQRFERLVHEILGRQHFPVTASIGALIIDPGAKVSQSELIVMTDQLMYEAKRSGKATVRTNHVPRAATGAAELAA